MFRKFLGLKGIWQVIRLYVKMAAGQKCATNNCGLVEREEKARTQNPPHPCSLKQGVHRAGQKIISSTKIPARTEIQ